MENAPKSSGPSEVSTDLPGNGPRPDCEVPQSPGVPGRALEKLFLDAAQLTSQVEWYNSASTPQRISTNELWRRCRKGGKFSTVAEQALHWARRKSLALEGVAYEEYDALFGAGNAAPKDPSHAGDPTRKSASSGFTKDKEAVADREAQELEAAQAAAAERQALRTAEEQAALESAAAQERTKWEQEAAQEAAEAVARGSKASAAQKAAVAAEAAARQRKKAAAHKAAKAAEASVQEREAAAAQAAAVAAQDAEQEREVAAAAAQEAAAAAQQEASASAALQQAAQEFLGEWKPSVERQVHR